MPRHVHERYLPPGRERKPGETEVYGHFTRFLFLEAVGVNAREGEHKGRFAMVNMACGSYYVHDDIIIKGTNPREAEICAFY